MKLKKVRIKKFKRFTDLTIQNIPGSARLIVLAGPNGCGKSSFIDALNTWHGWKSKKNRAWDEDYHSKGGTVSPRPGYQQNNLEVEFHDPIPNSTKKILYARSAYRNDPDFQVQSFNRVGDPLDEIRVSRMIDNDGAVGKNFQRLVSQAVEDAFEPEDGTVTLEQFKENVIGDVSTAFTRLFSDITLDGLGNPLEDGTFRFTKGDSKGFSFKNLSGGEKSTFDLILDLVVARRAYDNTVFCIDEPESHMNTRLQAELLSELHRLIPKKCQLMLATHSIGMMRRARDIERADPGSVVFLDFEDLDFDQPQVIEPVKPNRAFWEKAYQVALNDIASLVAPERVVICEGQPITASPVRNHSHDARCYDTIFEAKYPETRFVSMGNHFEVSTDKHKLAATLGLLVKGLDISRLIDRDDRSEEEISEYKEAGCRVLSRRNLESYLFDNEVLRALAKSVNKEELADQLIERKQGILVEVNKEPTNDLKPASGRIYTACKETLGMVHPGNDAKAFMRDTLSKVIRPGMAVYDSLEQDIFAA